MSCCGEEATRVRGGGVADLVGLADWVLTRGGI